MTELIPGEHDDATFVALVRQIINAAIAAMETRELLVVDIDNRCDHKWLGCGT